VCAFRRDQTTGTNAFFSNSSRPMWPSYQFELAIFPALAHEQSIGHPHLAQVA
jgi:hypothetical protein